MRKLIVSAIAGFALAMGMASGAHAQGACQFVGSAGIQAGVIDADTTPEGGKFFFSGTLGPCAGTSGKVCSVGTLSNAACPANMHGGTFKVCTGGCTITCDGGQCPTNGNWNNAVISSCNGEVASGSFQGVCVGSNCSGGGADGIAYSLFFDAPTIQNAVTQCSGTGSITSASFVGVGAFQ